MVAAWLGYLAFLAGALVFYVMFTGWLGGYLLALVLLMPILSLLLSLPGVFMLQISLHPAQSKFQRGTPTGMGLRVCNRWCLPLRRVSLGLHYTNLLSGEEAVEKISFPLGCGEEGIGHSFSALHCGLLRCQIRLCRVYDFLGLFPLPLGRVEPLFMLIEPLGQGRDLPGGGGPQPEISPQDGATSSPGLEEYSLRNYRQGDSLRAIHWKLSSKLEQLVVRQPEGSGQGAVYLAFDWWGTPRRLDSMLDALADASDYLHTQGQRHVFCWAQARGLQEWPVETPEDFAKLLWRLGSEPAPQEPVDTLAAWQQLGQPIPLELLLSLEPYDKGKGGSR